VSGFYGIAERRTAKDIFNGSHAHEVCQIRTAGGKLFYLKLTVVIVETTVQIPSQAFAIYLLASTN